jgi:hypothetical protein
VTSHLVLALQVALVSFGGEPCGVEPQVLLASARARLLVAKVVKPQVVVLRASSQTQLCSNREEGAPVVPGSIGEVYGIITELQQCWDHSRLDVVLPAPRGCNESLHRHHHCTASRLLSSYCTHSLDGEVQMSMCAVASDVHDKLHEVSG